MLGVFEHIMALLEANLIRCPKVAPHGYDFELVERTLAPAHPESQVRVPVRFRKNTASHG